MNELIKFLDWYDDDFMIPFHQINHLNEQFRKLSKTDTRGFPPTQMLIKDDVLTYELALAGFSRENIKIHASDDTIQVKGEKPDDGPHLHASRNFTWGRRDYNQIWDFKHAEIQYKDGLLTIKVKKKPEAEVKELTIL